MRGRFLLTGLFLMAQLFSVSGYAIESNCPWNLHLLMGKGAADRLEPSTQLALQDILKAVYDNPPEPGKPLNSKTSVADDLWLNEFSMWDIVREMAELGQQRLHREKVDRKRKLTRASFFGTLGLFGGAAILSFALDPNRFSLLPPEAQYAEDDDDKEPGLPVIKERATATGTKIADPAYDLLKAMLACDPHRDLAPNKERLRESFSDFELKSKQLAEKIIERLVMGRSNAGYQTAKEQDARQFASFTRIKKMYEDFNVVLCTRWGHPSAEVMTERSLEELRSAFSNLPKELLKDQEIRMVMIPASSWVSSKQNPFQAEVQLGENGELELYAGLSSRDQVRRNLIGASLVRNRYQKWPKEKKQAWENALKGEKGKEVERLYFQHAFDTGMHSRDVSVPADFMFSFLVAATVDGEAARRLKDQNPEAAKIIGTAKKELGFNFYE